MNINYEIKGYRNEDQRSNASVQLARHDIIWVVTVENAIHTPNEVRTSNRCLIPGTVEIKLREAPPFLDQAQKGTLLVDFVYRVFDNRFAANI